MSLPYYRKLVNLKIGLKWFKTFLLLFKAIKKKGNISKKRLNQSNEFDGEADFIKEEVTKNLFIICCVFVSKPIHE